MQRDDLYLNDIVEAAGHIAAFLAAADFDGLQKSELVRSAVEQKLAIIGEAAARISEPLKGRYPQIPWPQIVAFRNISFTPISGLTGIRSGRRLKWTVQFSAQTLVPF